jgi:acyl dehydratase
LHPALILDENIPSVFEFIMPLRVITSLDELKQLAGQEIGVSDWLELTQERINQFAAATGDHQWIHIDTARAKAESPYGTTIAHGFLSLSLVSTLLASTIRLNIGGRMGINYGLNRVRFPSAVPAGARVRGRFSLVAVEEFSGGAQFTWGVTVEVENAPKPSVVAEWITRQYY